MKRTFLISLIILPAVMLIAIVAATSSSDTRPRIAAALETYLQYRAPFSTSRDLIEQIVPAASPRNFTRQMSQGTFSYLINNNRQPVVTQTVYSSPWYTSTELISQTEVVTGLVAYISPWPLAYPPTDVWCVRLRPDGNFYPEIVFVAHHEDDYHSEWIVHDPTAGTAQQLADDLAKLGCSEVERP